MCKVVSELISIVASNYIESIIQKNQMQRQFLLKMSHTDAILCLIDRIFDYLDLEDLEKMA